MGEGSMLCRVWLRREWRNVRISEEEEPEGGRRGVSCEIRLRGVCRGRSGSQDSSWDEC